MAFVAEWLQGVVRTMQEKADAKYEDELKNWKQAAADWVAAGVITRDNGGTVGPFVKIAPARVVFGVDDNGNLTQTSVTDSSIEKPVLPPASAKQPSTAFVTGAPAQSDAILETLTLVRQIAAYFPVGGLQ
jgi:hypothetical protein